MTDAPRRRRGRRPVRLLRDRPAAEGRLRGRPDRAAADAVRARPRGRRAGPPEDQERHARVREDRAAPGVPLLRRRRARQRRHRARTCSSATTRSSTRSAPPPTTGSASPARTAPARIPPRSSWPGTTATRTTPTRRSTSPPTRAVVVGNGNVAVDVARMLVLDPDEVAVTDTADHAVEPLAAAQVHEVVVLGRRGPAQAAFTTPELRELGELTRADIVVDPADLELDAASAAWLESDGRPDRASATSSCCASTPRASRPATAPRRAALPALARRDPRRRRGRPGHRHARSCATGSSRRDGRLRAVPTGEEEVIACGLVLRSIGYRGRPLADIPFDERRGLIRNEGGRVSDEDGEPRRRRVRRRLDQARPDGRHRHEQEGRHRHRRADPRGRRGRPPATSPPADRRDGELCAERCPGLVTWDGLAGDRRARARPRRARRAARASSSSAPTRCSTSAAAARCPSAGAPPPTLRRQRLEPPEALAQSCRLEGMH